LVLSVWDEDNKVQYPGVVISDVPFRAVTGGEWDCVSIGVQPSLEVGYFVGKAKIA
jgi:hypothetical protein